MNCNCDTGDDFREDCEVHVECDDGCRALLDPQTLAEALAAAEHWRRHRHLSGCSHAC